MNNEQVSSGDSVGCHQGLLEAFEQPSGGKMKHLSNLVKAFFFCTACLWVLPLVAQERTLLSLEQAIQLAVTNNRQLQAAYQLQDIAKRGVGQARAV